MSTHRVVLDIPEEEYNILRSSIADGTYASESEAITGLIPGLLLEEIPTLRDAGQLKDEKWLAAEICLACDEADSDPDAFFTVEQVRAHLKADRDYQAGH